MASIQKRGENSYLLVVETGYDAKGKRKRKTKTIRVEDPTLLRAPKRLENYLNEELLKFKIKVEAGAYIAPEKMRFKHFVQEWDLKFAQNQLAVTTRSKYMDHLNNHIIPYFDQMWMDKILTVHIEEFLIHLSMPGVRKDGKKDEGLSDRTISDAYDALKSIFKKAKDWKVIEENPMDSVEKPKYKKKEMNYYEEEEAEQVIIALYNDLSLMWRIYFLGAMIGGMRRGELTALEWKDIDFDKLTITVRQNIPKYVDKKPVIKEPKNGESRVIGMPSWYMDELKEYKTKWDKNRNILTLKKEWEGGDYEFLFHAGSGKPLYFTTPTTKWNRFIKRNKLKHIRLHDLRHTMVTLLIQAGANMKAISNRAGHRDTKVTDSTYGHVTKSLNRDTAEKFDKFNPKLIVNNSSTKLG